MSDRREVATERKLVSLRSKQPGCVKQVGFCCRCLVADGLTVLGLSETADTAAAPASLRPQPGARGHQRSLLSHTGSSHALGVSTACRGPRAEQRWLPVKFNRHRVSVCVTQRWVSLPPLPRAVSGWFPPALPPSQPLMTDWPSWRRGGSPVLPVGWPCVLPRGQLFVQDTREEP